MFLFQENYTCKNSKQRTFKTEIYDMKKLKKSKIVKWEYVLMELLKLSWF